MISPFWLVISFDMWVFEVDSDLGMDFSNQVRSRRLSAVLNPIFRVFVGTRRWTIGGK